MLNSWTVLEQGVVEEDIPVLFSVDSGAVWLAAALEECSCEQAGRWRTAFSVQKRLCKSMTQTVHGVEKAKHITDALKIKHVMVGKRC